MNALRRSGFAVLGLCALGCSSPMAPIEGCAPTSPATGIPDFDLVGALRATGAQVVELGERFDLTVLSVPTQVLSVDGEEVLMWRYCCCGDVARDLGLFGIGAFAKDPPVVVQGPESHLFLVDRVLAEVTRPSPALLSLMERVMGPELELP